MRQNLTEQFGKIIETLQNGYLLIDRKGNIKDVNPAYCEMIGYDREELLSMNLGEIHSGVSENYQERFFRRALEEDSIGFEARHISQDGEVVEFWGSATIVEVKGEKYIAEFLRDISEKKEVERRLRKSEQQFKSLFEQNPHPVYLFDLEGNFIQFNDKLVEYTGCSREELLQMNFVPFIHEEDVEKSKKQFQKAASGEPTEYETRVVVRDGQQREIHVTKFPMYKEGEVAGVYCILQDITDAKEAKRKLEEKEVLLKEVHHRVKNNMAVVSGMLDLQAMSTEDEKLKRLLEGSQLRILSMAMIHEKLYQTETLSDISFDKYIKELTETILGTVGSSDKEIEVTFDLEEISLNINQAIPCALILNELVVNSFKHAFKGKKEGLVQIELEEKDSEIELCISGDGVGLPEDFELSQQNSLGMSLVATLIQQLEGELNMNNRRERGTKFQIVFSRH